MGLYEVHRRRRRFLRMAPAASSDIPAEWPEQSGLACCSLEACII